MFKLISALNIPQPFSYVSQSYCSFKKKVWNANKYARVVAQEMVLCAESAAFSHVASDSAIFFMRISKENCTFVYKKN